METGFKGTSMSILSGIDSSIANTNYGKKISNDVNTGWATADPGLASDILSLGGMSKTLGSDKTDEYVLSMSYVPDGCQPRPHPERRLRPARQGFQGQMGERRHEEFRRHQEVRARPWNPSYKLGTYGVDTATNTAWAVINYNGDFAVGRFPLF